MTCIVGVIDNGTVVIGGDSAGTNWGKREIYTVTTPKVFKIGPYVMGYTTSYRLGQVLRFSTPFPEPPEDGLAEYMATQFVESLRVTLDAQGLGHDLGPKGSILVGVRDQLFTVCAHLEVLQESTPYSAIGAGRHCAYGALYALEDSGRAARERAEIALKAAQASIRWSGSRSFSSQGSFSNRCDVTKSPRHANATCRRRSFRGAGRGSRSRPA